MTFAQPFKDYEVLDRIGSGAMGTVFKARHKRLNRIVALKVLRPSLARDERYVDRLGREARIVAAFNHPNIVTGYDIGQEGAYHFFVMEFVEGKSLRELLTEWGSFPEVQVLETALRITSALDHAFKKGVIHRDIKPGNILIDSDNNVKLTDMGLAKGPTDLTITREGATVGTPQYISPEQAKDPQNVDVRSDLYSLGATLYHMCTGQAPFRANTMAEVLLKVMSERPPSVNEVNPEVSSGLSAVISKLMAKNPDLRYQTPAELLVDLEKVRRREQPDVNLKQLEALDRVDDKVRARPLWVTAIVSVCVLLGVIWAISMFQNGNGGTEPPGVPDDPKEKYRQALHNELRGIKPWVDKFDVLRSHERLDEAPWQKKILRKLRLGIEEDFANALRDVLKQQEAALRAWVEGWKPGQRFKSGQRFLEEQLPQELYERFKLLPNGLRGQASRVYKQERNALAAKVATYEDRRNADYLRRLRGHLDNLFAGRYQEVLDQHDFRTARFELEQSLLRVVTASGPALDELPEDLGQQARQLREAARKRESERIDGQERIVVAQFVGKKEALIQRVRNDLTDLRDPKVARRRLRAGQRRLQLVFPEDHFELSGNNPWSKAHRDLDALETEVKKEFAQYEVALFNNAVAIAYRIVLAEGRAEDAARFLQGHVFAPILVSQEELDRHVALLLSAEAACTELLEALPKDRTRFKVKRSVGAQEVFVRIKPVGKGRLVTVDRGELVSLAQLNVGSLLEQVEGRRFWQTLQPGSRPGLALWHTLSGDYSQIAKLTDERTKQFMNKTIVALARRLRAEELAPQIAATRELETAHKALRDGNWDKALSSVEEIRNKHQAFAAGHTHETTRIEDRAKDGKARRAALKKLRQKARDGVLVQIDEQWNVSVDYPFDQVSLRPGDDWQRAADGSLTFQSEKPTLNEASSAALRVPTLLAGADETITATLKISFPEEGAVPRLLFLRCHGMALVLGMLRDGRIVARSARRDELTSTQRLRQDLQKDLARVSRKAGPRLYPEVVHTLRWVIKRHGRKLRSEVYLDGEARPLIPTRDITRPTRPGSELVVIPLHPMTVHRLRFEGRIPR